MIKNFGDRGTQRFFEGDGSGFQGHAAPAVLRLTLLDSVEALRDLAGLPSSRLEQGDQPGRHSIRINNRWRLCFRWTDEGGPSDVEIVASRMVGA